MLDVAALTRAPLNGPRAILRLVHLFARLGEHPEGRTLAQLGADLAVPRTTLFTMLKVLESAGYLTHGDGLYQLGPEAVALGGVMVESPRRNFPRCAEGVLDAVSRRTGETVYLAVLTPDRMQCKYVSMVEADHWLRFSVKLGSHKPAYATGSGRAMLAFLPEAQFLPLVDRFSFERLTPRTVSSRRRLLTAIKAVRRLGVSTVDSGTVDGVTAIAAPIFGAAGEVVAALTVGGPSSRIAPRQAAIEDVARDAAEEISRILGFRDPWPPRPG